MEANTPTADVADDLHVVGRIEPPKRWPRPPLRELWSYRDLLYFLARRDVAVIYKQTAVGVAWAFIRPAVLAAIFSVFFGVLLHLPADGVPYPAFILTGFTLWFFFATAITKSAESTVTGAQLISKVYFPRMAIPLSALAAPAVDLLFSLIVLELALLVIYGFGPELDMLLLPLVIVLAAAFAAGAGLWLSALAVRWRDIHLVVPFLIQVAFFGSAVMYPLSVIPDHLQAYYSFNPIVGITEGFRAAMLPVGMNLWLLIGPAVTSIVLIATGLVFFTRAEQTFADVI